MFGARLQFLVKKKFFFFYIGPGWHELDELMFQVNRNPAQIPSAPGPCGWTCLLGVRVCTTAQGRGARWWLSGAWGAGSGGAAAATQPGVSCCPWNCLGRYCPSRVVRWT